MILAVFDSMVYLQAAANRKGAAGACLAFVEQGHVRLFISPVILGEVEDVLHRPGVRRAFPQLSDKAVTEFLDHLVDEAVVVEKVPLVFRLPRDPDDEPFLNLAIASQASFLVSRDKDLLSLMEDEGFRDQHPGLSILDPESFLNHVRTATAKPNG